MAIYKTTAIKASQAKSQFLAAASHDLRQPLHAQALFVDELLGRQLDQESKEIVHDLEKSIDAMRDLFNALLDVSKLDAGVIQPKVIDFPINVLLEELELEYGPQAREKGLSFQVIASKAFVCSDVAGQLMNKWRVMLTMKIRLTLIPLPIKNSTWHNQAWLLQ